MPIGKTQPKRKGSESLLVAEHIDVQGVWDSLIQCHGTPAQGWDREGIRPNPIKSYLCSFVFFIIKKQLQAIDPLETQIQKIAGQKHFQKPNHTLTKRAHFSFRIP